MTLQVSRISGSIKNLVNHGPWWLLSSNKKCN